MRIILVVCAMALSQVAMADGQAEIGYRQGIMSSVGGHMKAMISILKGGVHKDDFRFHAHAIADLAKIVPDIFPAGSGDGKTEALPAIWEKPDQFKQAVQKFVDAANGLSSAADSGDPSKIGPAVKALGEACKGCHDDFREAQQH